MLLVFFHVGSYSSCHGNATSHKWVKRQLTKQYGLEMWPTVLKKCTNRLLYITTPTSVTKRLQGNKLILLQACFINEHLK